MKQWTILFLIFIPLLFITCKTNKTVFESQNPVKSGISFSNSLVETDSLNIIEYLYFYNGGGVATGDINNDGLADIYLSANQQASKLYLNKGNFIFEDITSSSGTANPADWKTGVSMTDVNQDGWLDIYVCEVGEYKNIKGRNKLYINNHNNSFSEKAKEYGLDIVAFSTQAAWLDYDMDGDLDMYLLCHSVHSTDTYKDTSIRHTTDLLKGDKLFENQNGYFKEVSKEAGIQSSPIGYGLGIVISDFNNDLLPDIYIANDFHENDYLYINTGEKSFRQTQFQSFGHTSAFSMGVDASDINRDGLTDIISLDMKPYDEKIFKNSVGADPFDIFQYKNKFGYHFQYPRNALQLCQFIDSIGTPLYAEVAQQLGIDRTDWSWTPLIADFDNNGLPDIFITNGIAHRPNDLDYLKYHSSITNIDTAQSGNLISLMPQGKAKNQFYSQSQLLNFDNKSELWNPEGDDLSTAAAYADFDNDGDLDLIINRINATATLLKNNSSKSNFCSMRLDYIASNKFGIGTKVKMYTKSGTQTKEMYTVKGFQSASDYILHFGLNSDDKIDSIQLNWPNGLIQTEYDLKINTILSFKFTPDSIKLNPMSNASPVFSPVPFNAFLHHENEYNDFEREKLLLFKLSTQGPAMTVGDINNDGLEDFWIGGARGQSGAIFLQGSAGSFTLLDQVALSNDAMFEDTDGLFFDSDLDGDLDLMVASGGYQLDNPSLLLDRIYVNDGKLNFIKNESALPSVTHVSSCIAANDIDDDGDIDVFIGGRVAPYYGFNTDSYLLINDGTGHFRHTNIPILNGLGMITDATWAEIDNGAKGKELIVVGEWMPITIIKRDGPGWKKEIIDNSEGLWQCIESSDLDQDQDIDFVVGNVGNNTPFRATSQQAIEIFSADFDRNTTPESIVSYWVNATAYSFFSKDELASQLILFKKKYTDYKSFSSKTFDELFKDFNLKKDRKKISTTQSSILINEGKNGFQMRALPFEAQQSMLFTFLAEDYSNDQFPDILCGGNLFEVHPSFGRLDASSSPILINDGKMNFKYLPPYQSGIFTQGAIRDIKSIKIQNAKSILMARNNDSPLIYTVK